MRVSAPGSSANLGPGFDCLSLAVDRRYELSDEPLAGFDPVGPDDLVWAALEPTGASFPRLWYRSEIPAGRGMGASAAACVAAAFLGFRAGGIDAVAARESAFGVAAELERHPDNAAASAYGGLNLAQGEHIHTDAPAIGAGQLFMWIPATVSLTSENRGAIPDRLGVADAVAQAAACAATYAGLLTGSWDLLRGAHGDLIHEPHRLAALADSRAVIDALRAEGHIAWLSGSGPSVGALVEHDGERVTPAAPGEWLALGVDLEGCTEAA